MSWFQLDPESIAKRCAGNVLVPTLGVSLRRGMVGFTVVSVAGFAPWVLAGQWIHQHVGEAGLYAVCAAVFIGLSGPLLHRLIIGAGSLVRFYKLFGVGFAAYSIGWIVGWMALRGNFGSVVGLLVGTVAMGWIFTRAFDAGKEMLKVMTALFVLNALGYFIGGWVEGSVGRLNELSLPGFSLEKSACRALGKILWGVCYGVGFGAGLGLAFYFCQGRVRALLAKTK